MAQALRSIESQHEYTVEIVVYIAETVITTAVFCPGRYHLMLVKYDRDLYSSQDVLKRVTSQNVSARLIGPV